MELYLVKTRYRFVHGEKRVWRSAIARRLPHSEAHLMESIFLMDGFGYSKPPSIQCGTIL